MDSAAGYGATVVTVTVVGLAVEMDAGEVTLLRRWGVRRIGCLSQWGWGRVRAGGRRGRRGGGHRTNATARPTATTIDSASLPGQSTGEIRTSPTIRCTEPGSGRGHVQVRIAEAGVAQDGGVATGGAEADAEHLAEVLGVVAGGEGFVQDAVAAQFAGVRCGPRCCRAQPGPTQVVVTAVRAWTNRWGLLVVGHRSVRCWR